MRLISQDGMIDVPYENGSLSVGVGKVEEIEHTVIKYRNVSSTNGTKLAEYSSKAKALKVMEMLQKQFLDYCCNYHSQSGVFCFPKDEEVEV